MALKGGNVAHAMVHDDRFPEHGILVRGGTISQPAAFRVHRGCKAWIHKEASYWGNVEMHRSRKLLGFTAFLGGFCMSNIISVR